MRKYLAVAALLVLSTVVSAQTPDAIIQRAIQAHGGSDVLVKMKAVNVTARGKANLGGPEIEGTREFKWALPERASWLVEFPRERIKTLIVINGLSGWQQVGANPPADLPPAAYDTMVDDAYAFWLSTIAPLSRKEFTLAAAKDADVDGQPAFGVKVTKADRKEAILYFSKSNGLLVKIQYLGREAGTLVPKEIVFANHKEFDRVKLPTKVTDFVKNVKMGEWQITDYRFAEKFDPSTFRKP